MIFLYGVSLNDSCTTIKKISKDFILDFSNFKIAKIDNKSPIMDEIMHI